VNRFLCLAALSLSTFLACGSSHASTLAYQAIVSLSTGTTTPQYFAVGDFNADGKPDLAVPDFTGKTISIYLNKGGASFSAPVVNTLSIGSGLGEIVSGDFNGDGKADLAVATFAPNQVVIVLLSNGDGTFAVQPPIAGSFSFQSAKVADFNGDGHPDLYLGGNNRTYLFLGKGDGTFSQGSIGKAGSSPGIYVGVTAGDFNSDKKLDGIAIDIGPYGVGSLDFFPGDGINSLGDAVLFQPALFQNPQSVDVADLNHDGKLDLLVSGNGAAGGILGNGDGTFQIDQSQLIPIFEHNYNLNMTFADQVIVLAADLDQDGDPDAVVLDCTTGVVTLALNDGTGTFPTNLNTPYQFPTGPYSITTSDFNGDGLPDVVASEANSKTISLLLSMKNLNKPTVGFTNSGNDALVGTALTFKAAITGGTATATGTVSLLDGGSQIAQQTLDTSGNAAFTLSDLSAGVHVLNLSYSGDTNYAPGTSASLNQSVTDFQLAVTSASQTVAAGSVARYTLTLTPQAGFTGNVTLSCSGLPALSTCSAPTVNVGTAVASETVNVSTTATTTAGMRKSGGKTYACVLLGCLSLCSLRLKTRGTAKWLLMVLPVFLLSLMAGPVGCGGSSKQTVPGTPSGTSTITITATATQNGITVTHSSTATLIVQ
jgi:Bacterial Ig-like domain (group 3)/FG-GAP-like repeat